MSQQNKKMQLLGNEPIPQALLAMGIPTMIGMLVNALYNLVDAILLEDWERARWEQFQLCTH